LLTLYRLLAAKRSPIRRDMAYKLEEILQQHISSFTASEVKRRQQHMLQASGGLQDSMISVEHITQQVCSALNEGPESSNEQKRHSSAIAQESGARYDETCSAEFLSCAANVKWLKQNRRSARAAILLAYECLYAGSLASTTLHQLVRLVMLHRLGGHVGWKLISKCLRLANKRGLAGPKGFKKSREYTQCLELIVNVHASEVCASCLVVPLHSSHR
jgi:hypothetical protein